MKANHLNTFCGLTLLLGLNTASGISAYVSRIPNGSVNSCCNCHQACNPPALNSFGNAFLANGNVWNAALARLDSDGDGFTNGQELGDPTGSGTPIPGAQVTLPGDASSFPVLKPPNIRITIPTNGASFAPPFTGPITASSTNPPAAIVAVQFFSGTTLMGTATSPPYSQAVNLAAGGYTFTARAIDYLAASKTSAAVTITVGATAVPPAIVTQPASQTVFAGADVAFTVSASGTPPLAYQWRKGTTAISGATTTRLSLTSVAAADAGTYAVVVTNVAGSVTSARAVLTVNPAPVAPTITLQPVSQTVNAGANVSFMVAASGTAPLSYQWRKGTANISGATLAALSLTSVTTADAGSYSCVVSNVAGSATSSTATLTVNQVTVIISITSPTNGATYTAPATFQLAASATPAASIARVDLYQNVTLIGSASTAPYVFPVANLGAGSYTYRAIAASTSGNNTTSAPVSIKVTAPTPPTGPAVVTVTATDPNASEAGPDTGTFQVARTGSTTDSLTVYYFLGGTAINGQDYQMVGTNVTIPAGSATANVTITPILDTEVPTELSDTVILQLTGAPTGQTPYTIGDPSNAVVTIQEVLSTTNLPPVVKMIAPRDGAVFGAGQTILLVAKATDPDGTVVRVQFFSGTTSLGVGMPLPGEDDGEGEDDHGDDGHWGDNGGDDDHEGIESAKNFYFLKWPQVAAGQYTLTAVATDNLGAVTTSAPVHITVKSRTGGGKSETERD